MGPPFVPGQYVALGLNNTEVPEKGSVRRSMSILSAPEQREIYEFYIRWVKHPESDNPLTHLLWKMKDGDRIFMTRKPVGVFTVKDTVGETDPRWKIYVAAGTGLAPFVSILRSEHLRDPKADMSKTVLLHGASYPADLTYKEELDGYARQHGLHYFRTCSRPKEVPDWSGDTGRVEDYFKPEKLEDLERRLGVSPGGLTPRSCGVLICGLQGTIGETIMRLAPRGFVPTTAASARRSRSPTTCRPTSGGSSTTTPPSSTSTTPPWSPASPASSAPPGPPAPDPAGEATGERSPRAPRRHRRRETANPPRASVSTPDRTRFGPIL